MMVSLAKQEVKESQNSVLHFFPTKGTLSTRIQVLSNVANSRNGANLAYIMDNLD
jgi:hypothetical protein